MAKKQFLAIVLLLSTIGMLSAQTRRVTGHVSSSEDGEPVIGASVLVKGFSIGAQTDIDGNFILERVPDAAKTLVISYVGMKTKEVVIQPNLKVVLDSDTEVLDEVVITGMVPVDKRLFTGAADRLEGADVKLGGIQDVSRGLEGRSAGVSVQNVSGTFGTAPKITVRGATSIYGSSKPLWVVDGVILEDVVEVSADDLSSGDATTLISSAVAGLNAEDIESFDILKDGSATSIYGARAMAGVIVITTKKGRAGTTSFSYTGEFTTRLKPSYSNFNVMNSQEQMGVYGELYEKGWLNFATVYRSSNSGVYGKMYKMMNTYNPQTGLYDLYHDDGSAKRFLREAEYRNTDWFDLLFSNSVMMNHSVSFSSGSEKSTSYASMSFMDDPGWMKKSSVKRYTLNFNSLYNFNKKISFSFAGNGSYRKQMAPGTIGQDVDPVGGNVSRGFDINPFSYALNTSRTLDAKEHYMRNYAPFNIFDELDNNYLDLNVYDLRFQGELKWRPIKGMEISLLTATKYSGSSQEHKVTERSNQSIAHRAMDDATIRNANSWLYQDPDNPNALKESVLPRGGFYNVNSYGMFSYDVRLSGRYNTVFADDHIFNLFGGAEANSQTRTQNAFNGWGMQYESGERPFFDYRAFKQMREKNDNYFALYNTRNKNLAFFGMATYSYKGKYTLTGTARYEGTNRLGKARSARWLPTWNISGAWNVHDESFFESIKDIIPYLSLKGSYSLTGDAGPRFVTNSHVHIVNFTPWRPFANVGETGLRTYQLENKNLTYEKKHEFNFGADMGLLKNRLSIAFDIYTRNNHDLIGISNTQGVGGEPYRWANVASMKSSGFELSISTKNIRTRDFQWTTDFIFGHSSNLITKVESRSNVFQMLRGRGFREGQAYGAIYSLPFEGLNERGFPTFKLHDGIADKNNYKDINFQEREKVDYLKYEGLVTPPINGSFGNVFSYKGLKLNLFVTYAVGNKIRLDPTFRGFYTDLDATPREFANRWALPGEEKITHVPVILSTRDRRDYEYISKAYSAYNYSSVRIADGSFVRMKEISLLYDLPKSLVEGWGISSLSFKLQGTNLFLIYSDKKLEGQDPEFFKSGGVAAPVPKQFTLTTRVGF